MTGAERSRIPWWRAAAILLALGLLAAAYAMYPILNPASNPAPPATADVGAPGAITRAMATGPLAAFVVKPQRPAVADLAFADGAGKPLKLSDWRGKVTLVNIWATWWVTCQ